MTQPRTVTHGRRCFATQRWRTTSRKRTSRWRRFDVVISKCDDGTRHAWRNGTRRNADTCNAFDVSRKSIVWTAVVSFCNSSRVRILNIDWGQVRRYFAEKSIILCSGLNPLTGIWNFSRFQSRVFFGVVFSPELNLRLWGRNGSSNRRYNWNTVWTAVKSERGRCCPWNSDRGWADPGMVSVDCGSTSRHNPDHRSRRWGCRGRYDDRAWRNFVDAEQRWRSMFRLIGIRDCGPPRLLGLDLFDWGGGVGPAVPLVGLVAGRAVVMI